ncbi:MAG: hypothetical protein J6Y37_05510 [Paludibacteraceae bacterium]|nr:hypothetical protein [Paludibacteraceae bacterium]
MKQFIYTVGIFIAMLMSSCATTPAEYVETVSGEAEKMEAQNKIIVEYLSKRDIPGAEAALQAAKLEADKSLERLQKMESFEGNDELRQNCIEFVDFYKTIFNNEYEQAFDVLRKTDKRTTDDVNKLSEILLSVTTENQFVKADLVKSIKKFCKEYELTITNSKK